MAIEKIIYTTNVIKIGLISHIAIPLKMGKESGPPSVEEGRRNREARLSLIYAGWNWPRAASVNSGR